MSSIQERGVLGQAVDRFIKEIKSTLKGYSPKEEATVRRILSGEITEEDLAQHLAEKIGFISHHFYSSPVGPFSFESMSPLPLFLVGQLTKEEEERFHSLTPEKQKNEVLVAAQQKAIRWKLK